MSLFLKSLEFVGDIALNLAIANFVSVTYLDLDPGQLSTIRSMNINIENFVPVVVRRGVYTRMHHCASADISIVGSHLILGTFPYLYVSPMPYLSILAYLLFNVLYTLAERYDLTVTMVPRYNNVGGYNSILDCWLE